MEERASFDNSWLGPRFPVISVLKALELRAIANNGGWKKNGGGRDASVHTDFLTGIVSSITDGQKRQSAAVAP